MTTVPWSPRAARATISSPADLADLAFFYAYRPDGQPMALADLMKTAGIR
ncbi:hypothetical protein [Streptomyces griseus]